MATLTTFSANTLIKSAELNANFTGLSDGSMDTTANSLTQFRGEALKNCVISGGVWSGDAYASTRLASMTAMVVLINGRRISITAVTGRTFTASKDTYVDALDNLDGTGTLVYTEVTNNAASPALAANSIRLAIIITGATTIADVGSVNQGQETKILPIASSIPYQTTDSLGNLIFNNSPNGTLLGLRRRLSSFATTSTSFVDVTELNVPVISPASRKLRFNIDGSSIQNSAAGGIWGLALLEDGTVIQQWYRNQDGAGFNIPLGIGFKKTVTAGSHTYKLQALSGNIANTTTIGAGSATPGTTPFTAGPLSLSVELD